MSNDRVRLNSIRYASNCVSNYHVLLLLFSTQAVIKMIEIAKQQRDIAEVIADNTISGNKKKRIHGDRHCSLCSTSYKGTSETTKSRLWRCKGQQRVSGPHIQGYLDDPGKV